MTDEKVPLLTAVMKAQKTERQTIADSNVQNMHDPAIEILSESRQQVGGVAVTFRTGRIK